jgi:hypothetical protein
MAKEMVFGFEITDKRNKIFYFSVFLTRGLFETLYSLAVSSHKTT